MGDGGAGARRADDIELRWRGEPAIDVAEGVDGGREVAPHHVVDLLGLQQIGGGVDRDPEPAQHAGGLAPQRLVLRAGDEVVDGVVLAVGPQLVEGEAVEPAGRDRQQLLPRQRRDLAGVVDRCVETPLVEVALDEIAEDGAEAAAGPHPVEDALGQAHPLGGDRDRERVVVAATVGEVGVAQQRGDLGLVDRRGVQEPRVVDRPTQRPRLALDRFGDGVDRVRCESLDPAVAADQHARWAGRRAARRAGGSPARSPTRPPGARRRRASPATCGASTSALAVGDGERGGAERLDVRRRPDRRPTRAGRAPVPPPTGRSRCADQPSVESPNPKSSASWAGATVVSSISLVAAAACSRNQPWRTSAASSDAGRSSVAAATASTSAASRSRRAVV